MKTFYLVAFSVAAVVLTSPFVLAQTSLPNTVYNPVPSRIVGQPILQQTSLTSVAPNNLEGREFNQPISIAVDTSAAPPILYVADLQNNRVLAWKNASAFTKGDFADKVIGQRDFRSNAQQGPGRELTAGFTAPTAIAVDKSGNLYVADSGNNRVLRYPAPLSQTGDLLRVDLVIGQKDQTSRSANEGQNAPTEKTLSFGNGAYIAGLAFDPQGNLWVSDAGNNRVLRFPVSALGSTPSNEPAADLVLGQPDFVTNTVLPLTNPVNQQKNVLDQPSGIAIDPKGRVFVADLLNRVVVYAPPFGLGQGISRILGAGPTKGQFNVKISDTTLGATNINGNLIGTPNSVFFVGNNPYVVDTPNARILGYDVFESWPDETVSFSPPAKVVIGQPSFQGFLSNRGLLRPNNQSLGGPQVDASVPLIPGPYAATFAGKDLFVADSGNNRVLVFPQQSGGGFDTATRLLGQTDFQYNSANLIEGREMALNSGQNACFVINGIFSVGGSVVVDPNSNHMYVSDPGNNRVLGYLDYRKVNAGTKADLVIGQPDLFTAMVNYPGGNPNSVNAQGLYSPEGLAVDGDGNLYVADGCNGRLLRFPKPLDAPAGAGMPTADLVLGQPGFSGQPIHDLSRQTMKTAYGVAFTFDGHLVVSDPLANRILFFRKPAGGFQSGVNADNVFGQPDFRSSSATILNGPRLMNLDPDDHLYVADTGNNRIAIFPNVPFAGDNPTLLFSITGLNNPNGVVVNKTTREVWVANSNGGLVLRYPKYETLVLNPALTTASFGSPGPIAISLDPFGNPVVAEASANRVAFYYPAIDYTSSAGGIAGRYSGNAANYFQRFAPGMHAAIFPFLNSRFGDQTALNSSIPIATTLGDVQVFVGGIPAPLSYVSPNQINLVIPNLVPLGTQEFQVVRASTGQLIASINFKIDAVSPGLFTIDGSGSGQVSAINFADGSVNGPAHPVKAGQVLTLYGTGQGPVSTPQVDGVPTSGTVNVTGQTRVIVNGSFLPDASILFSGLSPGSVGLWQINITIPKDVPTSNIEVPIAVILNTDFSSTSDPLSGLVRRTTIRTTP